MTIRYSKTRLFSNLLLGSLFSVWSALKIVEGSADYFNYFQLFIGILMVGTFFFEKHHHYLKIENGVLIKNSLRRRTITLKEVVHIQSFSGQIRLQTSQEKFTINLGITDETSVKDLYCFLGSLELDPNDNPFKGYSHQST